MSGFILKIIAYIAMFLGHSAFVNDALIPLYFFGRLAFPIFAFLLVEGYVHTKNYKKYLTRLIVFAIISQIPAYRFIIGSYNIFENGFPIVYLNIFFTLTFGLISLKLYDIVKNKFKKGNKTIVTIISLIIPFIMAIIAEYLYFDYGFVGIALIMIFYLCRGHKILTSLSYSLLMISFMGQRLINVDTPLTVNYVRYILVQLLFLEISLVLITLYNGKRGKDNRYMRLGFYLFYPIHFFLLLLIQHFI